MKRISIRICAVIFGVVALRGAIASADTSDPLDLGKATHVNVYVKLDSDNKAVMSQTQDGEYHSGGLKWKYDKVALKITFYLGEGVKRLDGKTNDKENSKQCGNTLTLQKVSNGTPITQVGRVTAKRAQDCFWVVKKKGDPEDPKIVVNPQ